MKIYVSYAEKDRELALKVARELHNAGFETSGLITDIYPGENWGAALGRGLETADWCVFLLTAGSLSESDRMRSDLQYVFLQHRFADHVISFWLDGGEPTQNVPLPLIKLTPFRQAASRNPAEIAAEIALILDGAAVAG
jgi:hypothetical protein